jgi:hypothetical protein
MNRGSRVNHHAITVQLTTARARLDDSIYERRTGRP